MGDIETSAPVAATAVNGTSPLEMRDISISFPRLGQPPVEIVEHFNLVLSAGQLHCAAGRSGSGKTSLVRVAAGLAAPTAGIVLWSGDVIGNLSDERLAGLRRRHVGYVDQHPVAIDDLTTIDNVLLPLVPMGVTDAGVTAAQDLLGCFGLDDRLQARAGRLSGGERQRMAIARAMITDPAVLIVDEPTASLDREAADLVIGTLRGRADHGTTVIVATHDPQLMAVADSVTQLD